MLRYLKRQFLWKQLPLHILFFAGCTLFISLLAWGIRSPSDIIYLFVVMELMVLATQLWYCGKFYRNLSRFKRQWSQLPQGHQEEVEREFYLGDGVDGAFFTSYYLILCECKWIQINYAILPYDKIKWVKAVQPSADLPFISLEIYCTEGSRRTPDKYQINFGFRTDKAKIADFLNRLNDFREGNGKILQGQKSVNQPSNAKLRKELFQTPIAGLFFALGFFILYLIGALAAMNVESSLIKLGVSEIASQFWGSAAILFLMAGGDLLLCIYYLTQIWKLIKHASTESRTQVQYLQVLLLLLLFSIGITVVFLIDQNTFPIFIQSAKILFQ